MVDSGIITAILSTSASAGSGMNSEWVTAACALAVAAAGLIGWAARHTWRVVRRVIHFLDDYAGQPARDGMAAKPGLMARLASVEESVAHLATEMQPNHGSSLRDVVHRTASDVADIKAEQAAVRIRLERFDATQKGP